MSSHNYITLPRSKLFKLVWSKPVSELAKEFGISDVALAKRCRAINIPLPPRGYWAKVAAGQTPRRPSLPPFRPPLPKAKPTAPAALPGYVTSAAAAPLADEPAIIFDPVRPKPTPEEADQRSPEERALHERIDALTLPDHHDLTRAHPAVLRTARALKRPWRKDIVWPRGSRRGPILCLVGVSPAQQDRALRFLNTLMRAAERLGWTLEAPRREKAFRESVDRWERPERALAVIGRLLVEGEPVTLRIDERQRRSDHIPTPAERIAIQQGRGYSVPRFDFRASGELRVHAKEPGSSWTDQTWKDSARRPLQDQVLKVLRDLATIAVKRKQRREEDRLSALREQERQRREAAERETREANAKLVARLERQAGAWHRARYLRRYLRAVRQAVGSGVIAVDLEGERIDFLAWAEHYVEQLDPLNPEEHDPVFDHVRDYYSYGEEDAQFRKEMQRLLGGAWRDVIKPVTSRRDPRHVDEGTAPDADEPLDDE